MSRPPIASLKKSAEFYSIAVVIITKNEEHNIGDCLHSVQWVDEKVVVDAESTDRTLAIASQFTKNLYVRAWPGFGPQKNFGIKQTTAEWILVLDADERVTSLLAKEIIECIRTWNQGDPVAYRIPRRNYYYGEWVQGGGIYPDYQIRLFRRGLAWYNDVPIHENLNVSREISSLISHLDHYTEIAIVDHFKKFGNYTTSAATEKMKLLQKVWWYHLVINPTVVFVKTYLIKSGYQDGVRGLIIAVFASMYTFVKYAKIFETRGRLRSGIQVRQEEVR
jgi:glycosyltransferase involved in cell wall biosynthesis